jgi:hypothetical protein
MDKNISQVKPADARIVQAVRKLKSSKIVDQSIEVRKNQEDIKQSQNKPISINNTINQQKAKKALTPITQQNKNNNKDNIININNSNSNINNNIINNQNKNNINMIKRDISKSSSKNKISIDGSIVKPNTSSTSTNKTVSKTFDYETLKKYKKRQKSDYQKNLLSKKNIDKYKEECVNLIKKETEIKNLLAQIGIIKDEDYLLYITNNFFSKPYFLFSLEILILENVEEENTLKVFRTNKNVLPLKVVKNNFYRDEIIKDLKLKIYEGEYNNKFNNLMKSLDNSIDSLKNEQL